MADAAGLNPAAERRGGSSPSSGTTSESGASRFGRAHGILAGRILARLGNPRVGVVARIRAGALADRVPVLRLLAGVVVQVVCHVPVGDARSVPVDQRRRKMRRRSGFRAAGVDWSAPMTASAMRRIAAAAGEAGRATTSGTPSFTDRIMSTSV